METQANSNYENQVIDRFWADFKQQSLSIMESEPVLADLFNKLVFTCSNFDQCLARIISSKLATREVDKQQLFQVCMQAYAENRCLLENAIADVYAVLTRDPASSSIVRILMFLKGPHVIESWRISHWLWEQDRRDLACYIQSRISDVFSVDIHPAAKIGKGLMLDHATNIVIGETAVIEDTVSLLHDVTLGGTGKECGDRHPKVCKGVMIGAGAKILGNIRIGEGAIVGAGSVVLADVPSHTTVVGVPARVIGHPQMEMPSLDMDQTFKGCKSDNNEPLCPGIHVKQV